MFHRDRIFLISLSLLSSLGYAGDTPKSNHTVEIENKNPQKLPKMPKVEFDQPHTGNGGGGGGNSSSDVGSNTGGSILNFVGAVADYFKGPKPDYDKMRRDTKNQKFIECISKYGPQTSAQFYPEETAAYMQKQSEREMAELFKQQAAAAPAPAVPCVAASEARVIVTPKVSVSVAAPAPVVATPAPVVVAPVVATPTTTSVPASSAVGTRLVMIRKAVPVSAPTQAPVISAPAPTPVVVDPVTTPAPTPAVSTPSSSAKATADMSATSGSANGSSFIKGLGGGKAIGGIQGTTQLQMPTMNQLTPPKNYIKPLPTPPYVPEPQVPSLPSPTPTESDSLQWGKVLQDAGEGAAIAVGAMAIVYVGYKTGEGIYNGSKWLYKKLAGEAEKQVVQQVTPKSMHANLEFHQNTGHCEAPPKIKQKPGCLKADVQPGDPRTRGLADIEFPTDSTHIFRNQWGHFVHDTPETRNLLRDCYKKGTYHGFDGAGNHQFSMTNPKDGSQLWVKIREGGRISTAGCNEIHLPLSKETGFLFKPDCWKNPSAKGVGCTFVGGSLATMSSQVSKANIPEAFLFPVDTDPNIGDLNFHPFYNETYRNRYRPDYIKEFGIAEAPEGYYFEPVKNDGISLPAPPVVITAEQIKDERASKMSYAIRMKKKNMEDYVIMEEMRRRDKQQAKVLKNAFFKKDSL